jgi:DNA-binding transcriptional LysR family regulator
MFRITLRQLEIFRAVAGQGSTAAAARQLPLSQSATSAGLNQLERSLGVRLFDRIGKRLALNADGKALLPKALGILDNARQLESGASRSSEFELQIHASTTIGNYLVPRLLAGFRRRFPEGRVQARIGNTLEVIRAVQDFSAELGLIEGPCHESGLVVTPWVLDELVVVAAPAHPRTRSHGSRSVARSRSISSRPAPGYCARKARAPARRWTSRYYPTLIRSGRRAFSAAPKRSKTPPLSDSA